MLNAGFAEKQLLAVTSEQKISKIRENSILL